jgi:hypothetical protein
LVATAKILIADTNKQNKPPRQRILADRFGSACFADVPSSGSVGFILLEKRPAKAL